VGISGRLRQTAAWCLTFSCIWDRAAANLPHIVGRDGVCREPLRLSARIRQTTDGLEKIVWNRHDGWQKMTGEAGCVTQPPDRQ